MARGLAGIAALGPIGALATIAGALNNDTKTAVNVLVPSWIDALFAFAGVKVKVKGEQHLWSHRPAVFIFNHRNNFDAFIVAKIVRTDFTAVGKKEAARNPIVGPLGRLMRVAFIDRADTQKTIETMRPIVELTREGLSIIIAPEGTRAEGPLLPFKKGAFRMAMAAHVPIVPIVIRNADDIAAREDVFMNPGTVDVAILPPISVANWTLEDLSARIETVREVYVATLDDWPDGGLKLLGGKKRRVRTREKRS